MFACPAIEKFATKAHGIEKDSLSFDIKCICSVPSLIPFSISSFRRPDYWINTHLPGSHMSFQRELFSCIILNRERRENEAKAPSTNLSFTLNEKD